MLEKILAGIISLGMAYAQPSFAQPLQKTEQQAYVKLKKVLVKLNQEESIYHFLAMVRQESSTPGIPCNPKAVSRTGAAGYLQLQTQTAFEMGLTKLHDPDDFLDEKTEYGKQLRVIATENTLEQLTALDDRFDPERNLEAGVKYFLKLVKHYDNKKVPHHKTKKKVSIENAFGFAIIAYNLGITVTDRLLEKGFGTTDPDEFLKLMKNFSDKNNGIKWYNKFSKRMSRVTPQKVTEVTNYSIRITALKDHYKQTFK